MFPQDARTGSHGKEGVKQLNLYNAMIGNLGFEFLFNPIGQWESTFITNPYFLQVF